MVLAAGYLVARGIVLPPLQTACAYNAERDRCIDDMFCWPVSSSVLNILPRSATSSLVNRAGQLKSTPRGISDVGSRIARLWATPRMSFCFPSDFPHFSQLKVIRLKVRRYSIGHAEIRPTEMRIMLSREWRREAQQAQSHHYRSSLANELVDF